MKINTTIPTQSSFPRLCPEFQLLFLLMLSVAYDAIHMMSSQSVYQQLAAVYFSSPLLPVSMATNPKHDIAATPAR